MGEKLQTSSTRINSISQNMAVVKAYKGWHLHRSENVNTSLFMFVWPMQSLWPTRPCGKLTCKCKSTSLSRPRVSSAGASCVHPAWWKKSCRSAGVVPGYWSVPQRLVLPWREAQSTTNSWIKKARVRKCVCVCKWFQQVSGAFGCWSNLGAASQPGWHCEWCVCGLWHVEKIPLLQRPPQAEPQPATLRRTPGKGLQPPPFHNPVTRDPSSSVYQGHAVIMAWETADFLLWGVKLLLPTQFPDIPRPRSCKFGSREVF